ncbi:MAG: hypothetical protein AB2L14_16180 [Candidatus Xenobiia bacterium LiM19]
MSQMIQVVKNYFGMHNFKANLPKVQVSNEVNSPQDIVDVNSMKKLIDEVMIKFRGSEQLDNDLNRKEGAVVGSVEHGYADYSGSLEYDPKTEKPIDFKAEHTYNSIFDKAGETSKVSMEFKDDGKTTKYSFTSDSPSLFNIDNHMWRITGTESLVMDSRTGAILEAIVPKS